MSKDGITFSDTTSGDCVVFNGFTFLKIIKGILVKYANKTAYEAEIIVINSKYFSQPINFFSQALFFSHESEYHWAMLLAYGDFYWLKGISQNLPNNYQEWETNYIAANHLKELSFEWE